MRYNFENIKKNGLLLYEYVRGSHAYGLNIETSDIDTGGVFVLEVGMWLMPADSGISVRLE